MPSASEILEGLATIANAGRGVAVLWHGLVLAGFVAVALGWRPGRRTLGLLLAVPALSVAAHALGYGNPFNGIVFAGIGGAILVASLRLPADPVERGPIWAVATGCVLVVFGLVYPHFLVTDSSVEYLYAAPTGLIPCPTLSLTIGIALIADGLGSRMWAAVLAVAGLFYGLFGAAKLGVHIDLVLLAGALALLTITWRRSLEP